MTNSKGLSLIEVIIALAIIALVLTSSVSLQSALVRTISQVFYSVEDTVLLKNFYYQALEKEAYKQKEPFSQKEEEQRLVFEYRTSKSSQESALQSLKTVVREVASVSRRGLATEVTHKLYAYRYNSSHKKGEE